MHRLLTANCFDRVRIRPSPSGSAPGVMGVAQTAASLVAQGGFAVFGTRWPLVLNHLFVYRANTR
jgi:hypothetical protein